MGKIKIGVCADIHLDIARDGERRLDAFLKDAREENVDFIMHLGDFAYPNDTSKTKCPIELMPDNVRNAYERPSKIDKEAILAKYCNFEKPSYHTMGNHDFDFLSPEDALRLYRIERGYYSFHKNGWHFIVLDGNYFKDEEGNYHHYDCANYFYKDLPYINPEQLEWLEKELHDTDEPVVMFSHQALFKYDGCIKNLSDFEKIISEAKARGKEIRMCLSGHMHLDDLDEIDGTFYHNVISLFGFWLGSDYEYKRYSDKTEEEFPNLRYNIPYSKPVWSIITLDDEGFSIKGIKGRVVQPGPRKLGVKTWKINGCVKARNEKWKK